MVSQVVPKVGVYLVSRTNRSGLAASRDRLPQANIGYFWRLNLNTNSTRSLEPRFSSRTLPKMDLRDVPGSQCEQVLASTLQTADWPCACTNYG
jgi:hypothetical protein